MVTPELQQMLDNLPLNEPRSKLEPFRPFILRWRRDGRSYRRIREILATHCDVRVSHVAILKFVRKKARTRKPEPEFEEMRGDSTSKVSREDPFAEARARMRLQKAAPAPEKPPKLFEYTEEDAMKPIVFLNPNEKEK